VEVARVNETFTSLKVIHVAGDRMTAPIKRRYMPKS